MAPALVAGANVIFGIAVWALMSDLVLDNMRRGIRLVIRKHEVEGGSDFVVRVKLAR